MSGIRSEMRLPMDAPRRGTPRRPVDVARIMEAFRPTGGRAGKPRNPCSECGIASGPSIKRMRNRAWVYFCAHCAPPKFVTVIGRTRPGGLSAEVVDLAARVGEIDAEAIVAAGLMRKLKAYWYLTHLWRMGLLRRVRRGVYAPAKVQP